MHLVMQVEYSSAGNFLQYKSQIVYLSLTPNCGCSSIALVSIMQFTIVIINSGKASFNFGKSLLKSWLTIAAMTSPISS